MADRIIPIRKEAREGPLPLVPETLSEAHGQTLDLRRRSLRDLRISVTDRCNFRCTYCMPKEVFDHEPQKESRAPMAKDPLGPLCG